MTKDKLLKARPGSPLTLTEKRVVQLLQKGHTNDEIANALRCQTRTVADHVRMIRQKISARNRVQVAVWATTHPDLEQQV